MTTLALPSKGAIAQPTLDFLKDCGLKVRKPNPRQYSGKIAALPDVNVLFQRVKDVAYKVADGTAQIGVTGYDVIREHPHDDVMVIHDQLGFGHCELVVAVPESWIDVETMLDLLDVALDFRERHQRNLRVATTYTNLTRQFLHQHGIHHFTLVRAEGAIEAAPTTGYADVIVDLTQTGTTLRENRLRPLTDGSIVQSQACLIGNKHAIERSRDLRNILHIMLESIDAAMIGQHYIQITANVPGVSPQALADTLARYPVTTGLLGPTIAPIYKPSGEHSELPSYTVMLTIRHEDMQDAVKYLRDIGAAHVITTPASFVFSDQSKTYQRMLKALNLRQ